MGVATRVKNLGLELKACSLTPCQQAVYSALQRVPDNCSSSYKNMSKEMATEIKTIPNTPGVVSHV